MQDLVAVKDQIRSRVDLVEFISEHTALKRRGRNYVGLCPFHREKTPSFSVDPERQFFKCFGCNAGGDIFAFVQRRESVDFGEALRLLADRAGVRLHQPGSTLGAAKSDRAELLRANAWAVEVFHKNILEKELGASAREYLRSRGLDLEVAKRFGIGLAFEQGNQIQRTGGPAGFSQKVLLDAGLCRLGEDQSCYETFRDRLMFPIRDSMRRCVGFGGRTLGDHRAKYLNTPQTAVFDKSKALFGVDLARESIVANDEAIVVEGYTDCIAAHQHGFTNTVATLGTAATEAHMAALRRFCGRVILLFDSDSAGEAAADRALGTALKHNLLVRIANVPDNKDPAEYLQHSGAQGFRNVLNSAVDALGFKWNRTCARYQAHTSPGARREAVGDFVALIADLAQFGVLDAIQQGVIVAQLSDLLSVPAREVQRLLGGRFRGKESTSRSAGEGSRRRPADPEQAALRCVLEVLVNEPGFFERAESCFDPARFSDPVYQRLAGHVRNLALSVGEFSFAELLSCCADTLEAELLTDLATGGGEAGNHESVLEGALKRLAILADSRQGHAFREELKQGIVAGTAWPEGHLRDSLAQIHRQLAGQRRFAHHRAVEEHGRREDEERSSGATVWEG